jgi:hypothetical protein
MNAAILSVPTLQKAEGDIKEDALRNFLILKSYMLASLEACERSRWGGAKTRRSFASSGDNVTIFLDSSFFLLTSHLKLCC